jgi:predicted nucleic acid-binding protein
VAGYFVDSSALVKRYVNETGSVWLSGLVSPAAGNDIYIARITAVEVIAALTRRARGGTIAAADASGACLLFRNDLPHDDEIVEMTATLLNRAMTLAETHGLRGYDAVQLAAACEVNAFCTAHGLPPLTLVSADSELNTAATGKGLPVDDPNAHP